jgi:hypothetical protein
MRTPGPGLNRFDVKTIPDDDAKAIADYVLNTFNQEGKRNFLFHPESIVWGRAVRRGLKWPPSLNDAHQHHYNRNYEQNMDQPPHGVGSD